MIFQFARWPSVVTVLVAVGWPLIAAGEPLEARTVQLEGRGPFAVASRADPRIGPNITLGAYYVRERGAGPDQDLHVVRGEFAAKNGERRVRWASSRDCPGLYDGLVAMEALEPPRPNVPGQGLERPPPTPDGMIYVLWSSSTRLGSGEAAYDLTMSTNMDTPLALWFDGLLSALKPCWKPQAPAL